MADAPSSWDEYFAGRHWRIATEVTGTVVLPAGHPLNPEREGGASITLEYTRGRFEIDGAVFHSPLSSARGRKGILLQEVADGKDVEGSRIPVGVVVFRRARQEGAIL